MCNRFYTNDSTLGTVERERERERERDNRKNGMDHI